ncbi:Na(+)/H(+) antiporter subunit F [Lottiidibacillus patelloidae]|uniref:Na(+)/H(+) antiporter subunit F n=1 Tax=Lottiidibacillus patelloidae TaxID=2670334 RepID=A0A263BW50_9BACI|nr:Na(+)/H(+) antiporter subunit F1 [Lottiidibacillus patelloidae]OZM57782.1 Na(+)/H(+) antiporter subunit F [Lottiidibacillus patelloidae]
MSDLLTNVTLICLILLGACMLLLLYRVIIGPSNPDRAVALDTIGVIIIAMSGLLAILTETTYFNDIILLVGILTFIGTVALAKFLEKGVIIERDRN